MLSSIHRISFMPFHHSPGPRNFPTFLINSIPVSLHALTNPSTPGMCSNSSFVRGRAATIKSNVCKLTIGAASLSRRGIFDVTSLLNASSLLRAIVSALDGADGFAVVCGGEVIVFPCGGTCRDGAISIACASSWSLSSVGRA